VTEQYLDRWFWYSLLLFVFLQTDHFLMRIFLFAVIFFVSSGLFAQDRNNAYIEKFNSLAVKIMCETGIPASVILGIALHESAAGTSKLCTKNHNHFGIKRKVRSKKSRSGYRTTYGKFESDLAAYEQFASLISSKRFYNNLKGEMEYFKWLKAIKASGYASSPKWLLQVDHIIKKYNLTRFDIQ